MAKDDRSEAPTQKRKQEARKKGQVARSQELPAGLGLALAIAVLPLTLPRLGSTLANDWAISTQQIADPDTGTALSIFGNFFTNAALALAPAIAVVALGGMVAHWSMAGVKPNPNHLRPKWERINPKAGIKRIFSAHAVWELARNAIKLTLLGVVAWTAWKAGLERLLAGPGSLERSLGSITDTARSLLLRVAVLALLIGLADAIWQKRKHLKELKMTKQEVKDEHRQSEGDPLVKSEIKRRQLKMSRTRMIAEVARADVVVTNPTHFAVALAYEAGSPAPVVVAKGADEVAKRIKEEARKWGVPVRENKPLARALFRSAQVGDQIPLSLYQAVAEVLAAIYRTRRRAS